MNEPFIFKTRIYYQDTDAGKVVYHSKYLDFAERARTELLIALGFSQTRLIKEFELGFMVKSCNISFNAPARLEDELIIKTFTFEFKSASMKFKHLIEIECKNLVEIEVLVVCVNINTMRPARIPEELKKKLEKYV